MYSKNLSLLFALLISLMAIGQSQSGIIKYKQTTYFDFENMPGNVGRQMPVDMPKSVDAFMQLSFNATESLYEKDADYKEEVNPNDNTPRMFKRMRERSNKTIYKNSINGTSLEQISFFGKDFLVSDSIVPLKWKVSAGEQKVILGYTCMKATFKDSTNNLVVFFTPQMPVGAGPDSYSHLPGVILEVQSAQVHIIATEVKPNAVSINKPTKGTAMSKAEFTKVRDEKIKEQLEMRGTGPGRGGMHIIRQ